jgi:hypothetical protein
MDFLERVFVISRVQVHDEQKIAIYGFLIDLRLFDGDAWSKIILH